VAPGRCIRIFRRPSRSAIAVACLGVGLAALVACDASDAPIDASPAASGTEEPAAPDVVPPRAESKDGARPTPAAAESGPADVGLEGPEAPPPPPLEDLVRLPPAVTDAHRELGRRDPQRPGSELPEEQEREAARLRIEVEAREDAAGFDPKRPRKHREAEAGVAVEVGEDTRLRGGARVEQQDDREWTPPAPTVGVEKRF